MSCKPSGSTALSWMEVLEDEHLELTSTQLSESERTTRQQFVAAREHCLAHNIDPETNASYQAARNRYRDGVITRLHAGKRSALCFSGGGIRSATFGLGVLQGLAAHSRDNVPTERPRLLGEFDYLSTVSGGGYLGGWFSSWATRASQSHPDGGAAAIRALAAVPETDFDREPQEVRHLRRFSNYLMPKLGILSGDTLAAIASVFRNMFLNWLILVPLLAAVLLIPVFAERAIAPDEVPVGTEWVLLLVGALGVMIATGYVGYDLPSAGNARKRYSWYLWLCLFPLVVAAIHLSMFWVWLEPSDASAPFWDVVSLGRQNITWWHFGFFGTLMHGGGMLGGVIAARIFQKRPPTTIGVYATMVAAITGFLASVVAWVLARPSAAHGIADDRFYAIFGFTTIMGIFMFAGTLLVGGSSYFTKDRDREWWARSGGWLLAVTIAWLLFSTVVVFAPHVMAWLHLKLSSLAAGTGLAGWGAAKLGKDSDTPSGRRAKEESPIEVGSLLGIPLLKRLAVRLILPVFLLLLVMLLATANCELLEVINQLPDRLPSYWPSAVAPIGNSTAHVWWLALFYIAICALASRFINVNTFSLHAMYRERLIRGYLGASNTNRQPHPFTGFDESDDLTMASLTSSKPLHVVNMALNLVGGNNLAWQQRKAESFTSTRLHTGSCRVSYRPSAEYGGRYKSRRSPITLGTTITISGAAASPNMGYHSSPLLTIVMTLFNARLGWWLGNPRDRDDAWKQPGPNWGIRSFVDEAFGFTDDDNAWIYLSDGGHFENLAIYEMVMRRCATIVVSDAGADPTYTYEDLGNAVRKIRVDLGIPIEFDDRMPMWPERKPVDRLPGYHCAIGTIRYDAVDGPNAPLGTLVYIKPSLNGNEPADVLHYSSTDSSFPHQPTPDQFFDEAQFESYRRLGLHVIEEICHCGKPGEQQSAMPCTLDLNEFVRSARRYTGTAEAAAASRS